MTQTIRQTIEGEGDWRGGRRARLRFHAGGEEIPAILLLPDETGPHPAALPTPSTMCSLRDE